MIFPLQPLCNREDAKAAKMNRQENQKYFFAFFAPLHFQHALKLV